MRTDCTCPPDDCASLVDTAASGDQQAWQRIHAMFSPRIAGYVRHRLGSDRSAYWEDAQQEILCRTFVKLHTWNQSGRFCDWLTVVAYRLAINIGIKLKHHRNEEEFGDFDPEAARAVDPGVVECLELTRASFPANWRTALMMRSQGYKNADVAAELGVSTRTIKTWISSMYDTMHKCLPEGDED